MTNIKIKKLLTASASGLAIAACMGASAHAATNVGTSASNTGTASGTGTVYLFNVASGTLTNSGTITTTGTDAAVVATSVSGSTITNTGTISNTSTGSAVLLGGTTGTLTNSGTITSAASTVVTTGTGSVTINNLSGGTISTTATAAGNAAIDIFANTAVTNAGTISATGAANAIRVSSGVSAASTTITNSAGGVIKTTGAGSAILVQSPITSITNAGTIESTAGTAIEVTANGSITSGITNSSTGSIIGGGGDAIDARNSANNLTVNNAGTITGNVRLGSGTNVVNATGGTISGQIFGAAGTTVNYSGTTTANGIVDVGAVNHTAGTLTVASGVSAATVTNSGGTLALNANITGNLVNSGGTVAIAANRTVTGNYTQSAGATFQSAISSRTTGSTLTVTGTATLADSSIIKAQIADGVTLQAGDAFTVLSAGTLTTTVGNLVVNSSDPFAKFTASKASETLVLTAAAASTAEAKSAILTNSGFASLAALQTAAGGGAGGTNVGNAFNSYTTLLSTLRTSDLTTYNRINNALSALSGAAAANAIATLAPSAATSAGTSQGVVAGGATSGGIVLSRLDNTRNAEAGMSAGDKYSRNAKAWFQPYGSALSQDRKNGVDGYDADTYGILFGGDVNILDNTRAGVAVGYNRTKVDAQGNSVGSGATTDGYEVKVYGGYSLNNYFVDALLGAQYNENDARRRSTLLNETARGSYDSWLYNARLSAGYNFKQAGGLILTPNVGFNYSYLDADGYTERGATINNRVNSSDFTGATSELGLKAAYPIKRTTGTLTPEVRATWLHEFGDSEFSNTSTFTGGGSSYKTTGAKIDEDAGRFGVGLGFQTIGKTEINADVDYISRSSSEAIAGKLNVKVPF